MTSSDPWLLQTFAKITKDHEFQFSHFEAGSVRPCWRGPQFLKGYSSRPEDPDKETFRAPEALCCPCCSSPGLAAPKIERFHCWANVIFATISHYQPLKHRLTMAGTEASCLSRTWLKNRCQRVTYFAATNFSSFLVDLMSLRPWQACRLSKIFSPTVALNYQFLTFSDRCK